MAVSGSRRGRRFRRSVVPRQLTRSPAVAFVALIAVTLIQFTTGSVALAATACGTVQVAAGSWLLGQGVEVHSNGGYQGTGNSCNGWSTANPGVQDGYGWQCVELASRLYAVKGWGSVRADGGAASGTYQYGAKYIPEGSPGLNFHANGSGYLPVPGDLIVEWSSTWGHVSVVDKTIGGSVYAVEENASASGQHTYTLVGSTLGGQYGSSVRGVMHATGNTATAGGGGLPVDGSFVAISGQPEIYRVVGGAPIYVSTWDAFGGSQPVTVLGAATFAQLRPVPAEGTFLRGAQRGEIYRIAGGAPVYLSSWDAFGGPKPSIDVDQAAIDNAGAGGVWNHLSYRPADGVFVVGGQRGEVYRMVGGAPVYVSTWDAFGGAQPTVAVDQAALDNAGAGGVWNHVAYRPADGTFIAGQQRGEVYRMAGGAPIYVSTWDAFGGPQPVIEVDQAAVDNAGSSGIWMHMNAQPADGTFVVGAQRGEVYRFAGGAPLYVSTWDAFGGPQPAVAVDTAALDSAQAGGAFGHVLMRPVDGTFLRGAPSDNVFRVVGGAPYPIATAGTDTTRAVSITDATVANAGSGVPWQHLAAPVQAPTPPPTTTPPPATTPPTTPPIIPPAPAPAAVPASTSLTIRANHGTVRWGSEAVVEGILTGPSASGVPGATVIVQAKLAGAAPWSPVTTVSTSPTGAWSASVKPTVNRSYRAVYLAGGTTSAITSASVAIAVAPKITLRMSKAKASLGARVTFSGKVSPSQRGRVVSLQRRGAGRWVTTKSTRLTSRSTYSMVWASVSRAKFLWRVVLPKRSDHAVGRSPTVKLTIT